MVKATEDGRSRRRCMFLDTGKFCHCATPYVDLFLLLRGGGVGGLRGFRGVRGRRLTYQQVLLCASNTDRVRIRFYPGSV